MEKYDAMMSSHELTNGLLNEAQNQIQSLQLTSDALESMQLRFNLLEASNSQLNTQITHLELKLKTKADEVVQANETIAVLSANFELMDQQREKIEFLEIECEKHLTEKHVECERRINELTSECQNNVGFIQAQKNELCMLELTIQLGLCVFN